MELMDFASPPNLFLLFLDIFKTLIEVMLRKLTPPSKSTTMTQLHHLLHLSTASSLLLKQKSLPLFKPLKTNNATSTQSQRPYLKTVAKYSLSNLLLAYLTIN